MEDCCECPPAGADADADEDADAGKGETVGLLGALELELVGVGVEVLHRNLKNPPSPVLGYAAEGGLEGDCSRCGEFAMYTELAFRLQPTSLLIPGFRFNASSSISVFARASWRFDFVSVRFVSSSVCAWCVLCSWRA